MSDELIELPEGWEWVSFEKVVVNHDGRRIPVNSSDRKGKQGEFPYYGASGIIDYVDDFLFEGKHLLIAEDGANLLSRSTPIAFEADGKFWVNNHAHIVQAIETLVLSPYLRDYLNFKDLSFYISGSAQPKLNQKNLNRIPIPLPPLNEQKRIVTQIEALRERSQKAKAALEAIPELCDRFRQSVLAAAFRGDLTADWREENPDVEPASVLLERIKKEYKMRWSNTDEKLGKYREPTIETQIDLTVLPESWCWLPLELVANAIDPHPSHRTPPECSGGIPYVSIGDLQNDGTINFESARKISHTVLEEHRQRYTLKIGDFIFGKIGTLGKPFKLSLPFNYALSANVILLQPRSSLMVADWLYYFLKSPFIEALLRKDSRATSQAAFGIKRLRLLPVPIPHIEEQRQIISRIENCFLSMEKLESVNQIGLSQISCLNQSILAKAFRGELVEQDPNDEPASVLLERIRAEREAQQPAKKQRRNKQKSTDSEQINLPLE